VDSTTINTSSTSATPNYTVTVTHDEGSGFVVNGKITVSNPSLVAISGIDLSDEVDNGGTCSVTNGTGIALASMESTTRDYTCTYGSKPEVGLNTATATWTAPSGLRTDPGFAVVDFGAATIVDKTVTITDSLGGTLGTIDVTAEHDNPATFTYPHTFTDLPAGTCTTKPNTATLTSTAPADPLNPTKIEKSKDVQICVQANLIVSKDAAPAYTRTYNWKVTKSVDKTLIEQGGSAAFNYTVVAEETGFVDTGWKVTGTITVTNPNDWGSIAGITVSDAINLNGCQVTAAPM
jgi:hypothetical protein